MAKGGGKSETVEGGVGSELTEGGGEMQVSEGGEGTWRFWAKSPAVSVIWLQRGR